MKLKRQQEECARMEGWTPNKRFEWVNKDESISAPSLPTYESHDDLQRLIDGLDVRSSLREYWYELMAIMVRDRDGLHVREREMSLATPAQKREALLRAVGRWEGE